MVTMSKSKEIRDLLERILSFAAKRAEVHFQFAKEKEDDGAMFFTEDYKAYVSILDDATTALDLFKQQPIEGEFTKAIRQKVNCTAKIDYLHLGEVADWGAISKDILELCDRLDSAEARTKELLEAFEQSKEIFSKRLRSLRIKQEKAQENLAFIERRYWSGVYTEIFNLRHEIEHMLNDLKLNEYCIQMAFMPKEKIEVALAKAKKEG